MIHSYKFKIYPDDKWTDVGYFNESYRDQETFDEFCDHVKVQLLRSRRPKPKPGVKLTINEILEQGGDDRDHLN